MTHEVKFGIKQAEFLTSVGQGQNYPAPLACEIAIVGRSNVGKSSHINTLCGSRKLAKTSQTPGKTRLINYFVLNKEFYLVDLPGYGFAKTSKTEQRSWGDLIEAYLNSGRPKHLFLLIDIRMNFRGGPADVAGHSFGCSYTLVGQRRISEARARVAANRAAKLHGEPPYAWRFKAEESVERRLFAGIANL
jgi:hypothetical protein